jgi:hypothetical protein
MIMIKTVLNLLETRLHISDDTLLNNYKYNSFNMIKRPAVRTGFFSLTLGYGIIKHKWQKEPEVIKVSR